MRRFNRRSLMGYSLAGAGALLAGQARALGAGGWDPYANDGRESYIIDDTSAVAETESGTVSGYVRGGIRIFLGMPYGEIRTPEARWVRAAKPRPWAGKRSSRSPGPICPSDAPYQVNANAVDSPFGDEILHRDSDAQVWHAGEDCLRIHVWTPGTDNKKRPVIFWFQGGSFHNGNPLMLSRTEPHNLCRYGDVVVVSCSYRLHALGFLDLSAYGARYADSANLGMLDMIDALKWVQRNIGSFGGDAGNVTLAGPFGVQILTLLAMPEAKGLFHRAIPGSPGAPYLSTPEESAALASAFLKYMQVSPANLDALYKIPAEKLAEAAAVFTAASLGAEQGGGAKSALPSSGWRPMVDGRRVLYQPLAPSMASDIPMLTGSSLHENFVALGHPDWMGMPEAQARALVRGVMGAVGDGIYDVYRGAFPKAGPFEISAMARAMARVRAYAVRLAQARAALHSAPTYTYWFQWRAGTFAGRAMSHHELELPLIFLNSDALPALTGGSEEARALSLKMADSWLAFARSGNPNIPALPEWKPVTPDAVPAMVFDKDCRIDPGSDLAAIKLFWNNRKA